MQYLFNKWGDLASLKGIMWLKCNECPHEAVIYGKDISVQFGKEHSSKNTRFRCNKCQSKNVIAKPYYAAYRD